MRARLSEFSFSVRFLIEARPEIAKCRQLKRFQIFVTSFPSFGRGFDSHRPLHNFRWINWFYPAELPESDAKMDRFGLKLD
jgi:hypothetical protein